MTCSFHAKYTRGKMCIRDRQKITTDVTGNDTAGMVAGMVASGVIAKGLKMCIRDRAG